MTLFRRFLAIAFATTLISVASAQNLKIATVDMQELFKNYHQTIESDKQFDIEKAKITQANEERLVRIKEIDANIKNYKKQLEDPSVNESKKQTLRRDSDLKIQEFMELEKERNEFLKRRSEVLSQSMMERRRALLNNIRELIKERSKADNYDLVIDKSGASSLQDPVILYSKDAMDITASLLKDLNKDAPADK